MQINKIKIQKKILNKIFKTYQMNNMKINWLNIKIIKKFKIFLYNKLIKFNNKIKVLC